MSGGLITRRAMRVNSSGTLPASPVVSDVFLKTGASEGLYVCLAAGVWIGPYPTSGGAAAGETLLSTTTLNLRLTTAQDLYTVPALKSLVATRVIVRSHSPSPLEDADNLTFTESAFSQGLFAVFSLPLLNTAAKCLNYVETASLAGRVIVGAGAKVQATHSTDYGATATAVVDLFGYLYTP